MHVGEALRRRRMVRRFTGGPIESDAAERIAAAATRAPTAGNAQGITVISVTDAGKIGEIARACGEERYVERGFDPWLSTAAQHIVLCAEPERYRERYSEPDKDQAVLDAVPWWWVDAGASLMAVLLSAVDHGLAAGFHGGHGADGVREVLGIPDEVLVVGVVAIGHPAPDQRSSSLDRPKRDDAVRRERW
ncbi:MAG: nitroreductase family protein [Acidimicrobiia bacterium]